MANPYAYIAHQLNNSKSKYAHIFPKSIRFPPFHRLATYAVYDLPPTNNRRTCSFGYGTKADLALKTSSPPPGSYKAMSDFDKKDFQNTPSLGYGREQVKFGSFIEVAIKSTKGMPSPDRYNIKLPYSKLGGNMGKRISTEPDLKYKRSVPGPGHYKLTVTEMSQTGSYILSTYKNETSPRLFEERTIKRLKTDHSVSYDIKDTIDGRYPESKFKNLIVRSFPKSVRPGMEDKSKKNMPGFKYRRFSEFGDFR